EHFARVATEDCNAVVLGDAALAERAGKSERASAELGICEPPVAINDPQCLREHVQCAVEQHQRREDRAIGWQARPLVARPELLEDRRRWRVRGRVGGQCRWHNRECWIRGWEGHRSAAGSSVNTPWYGVAKDSGGSERALVVASLGLSEQHHRKQ